MNSLSEQEISLVNPRLARLADYPFTRLAALLGGLTPAAALEPVVLSVGEPQHAPPALLEEALQRHRHLWNRYPAVNGTPEFRAAVADWLCRRYRLPPSCLDPDRSVLPVAGTREALFLAALLAVPERRRGDLPVVLIPNPFYAVYQGAAVMAGAQPVFMPATAATGDLPALDALAPALLDRTALMYLCTPANPQGAAAAPAYLEQALQLARRHGFVLAVDECYAEIYDTQPPAGALSAALSLGHDGPDPWDRLLVFHSLSKRSSAAGLRSGFVAGDAGLIGAFGRLRSYANAGTPLPVLAAAAALWRDDVHVEANRALYRQKFDAAEAALAGVGVGFRRPAGGFFLWLPVGDGEAAARRLWSEAALRVLPGAYLTVPAADGTNHGAPYIRVALVHETAVVADACARIANCLQPRKTLP